ncbi:MAG: endonuclease [Sedimenticola sp.]
MALLAASVTSCNADGQTRFREYMEIFPFFWGELYAKGGETLYCGTAFGSNKGRGINIEHVYPMAWAMKAEGCRSRKQCRNTSQRFNRIESDLHNLYPSLARINKARGAMAYGMIKGERRHFGRCDFETDERARRVEPRPASRGNIARAMFYMHDTYGLTIFKRQGELLKQWNRKDPPDREERRRNGLIDEIQGTRNRFIDNPRAAEKLRF